MAYFAGSAPEPVYLMSIMPAFAPKSSSGVRAAFWIGLPLLLLIGVAGSAWAQDGPGGYGPGGGYGMHPRGGGGGHRFGSRGGGGSMPSAAAIEGPPSPAILRDSVGVSGDPLQRYSQMYANHTAATRPLRDSLRTTIQAMRSAFQSGDRSEAQQRRDAVQQQWKELSQRDKDFDKAAKDVLTKDQQKRYDKWKDNREKAARDQWRQERNSAGPGGTDAPEEQRPGRSNL